MASTSSDTIKSSCSCGYPASVMANLRRHVKTVHRGRRALWVCSTCGKEADSSRQFSDHARHVHGLRENDMTVKVKICEDDRPILETEDSHFNNMSDSNVEDVADGVFEMPEPAQAGNANVGETNAATIAENLRAEILQLVANLTGQLKVTDKAVDMVFSSLDRLEKIRQKSHAVPPDTIPPYSDFSSAYKRRKIMREEAGVVCPEAVAIGSREKLLSSGRIERVDIYGYFVPVLSELQLLLTHPEIYEAVRLSQSPVQHEQDASGQIWDIWIGMSIDDVEFSNPIGQGKGTHKQTIASYHLLNLPPEWRACDKAKNLLFICNANVFNKTPSADGPLFSDLRRSIEASRNGIHLVQGSSQLFRIHLKQVTADAEAMCSLLKMKKTGSRTLRPCWACDITSARMKTKLDVSGLTMRTLQSHLEDCRRIENCELTAQQRILEEMRRGVRGRSAMLDIPGFEFDLVCFDCMHCVLEGGLLELALRDFVRQLVESRVITLAELNRRIRQWQFKLQPGDVRPPELPDKVLTGGGLGYKARSCILLAENILFIVANKRHQAQIHFRQFARALRLSQSLLEAPSWSLDNTLILALRMLHVELVRLQMYPWATQIPKLHFILHLIKQILKHGATRYACCMPFERHYKVVKSKITACFKNLSFSLANFHQHWQIGALFEWKDGKKMPKTFKHTLIPQGQVKHQEIPAVIIDTFSAFIMTQRVWKNVKYGSARFAIGDVFEVGELESWEAQFVKIHLFLEDGDKISAIVQHLLKIEYERDFGCFRIRYGDYEMMDFTNMKHKFVLPSFVEGNELYVNRKYSPALEY